MDNIDKILHKSISTDELYHFGILGMKWGKRNGPPYPLGPDKSTGKRLKTKGERKGKDKKEHSQNILNKFQKEKEENEGYIKDEYGWLNKDLNVSGSNGKPTKLHAMIDGETYDRNTKQYRQKSDSEIKKEKDSIDEFAKDFKTYDKIAREAIRDDMKDRLQGWGDGKTNPDVFMNNLQNPTVRIDIEYDQAFISYS